MDKVQRIKAMTSPNIKDIAQAAAVSTATVSLALRNHPRISRETAQRIHECARKLGYRPNPLVTALMTHVRTTAHVTSATTLGFINAHGEKDPLKVSPGFARYYLGASRRAAELGYQLDTLWTKEPGMTSRRLTNILQARGIAGLLVAPLPRGKGHLSLDWPSFSACALNYSMWCPHLNRVASHHAHAISIALRKLHRLGYRRIGLALSPNFDERVDHQWYANFLLFQQSLKPEHRIPALLDDTTNMQNFPKWFQEHKPDAVVGAHQSAIDWLARLKANVPEEVGFVHLDVDPQVMDFSGIDQRSELIGSAAAELLIDQLNRNERGIPENPKLLLIESAWVEGSTTKPPPSAAKTKTLGVVHPPELANGVAHKGKRQRHKSKA